MGYYSGYYRGTFLSIKEKLYLLTILPAPSIPNVSPPVTLPVNPVGPELPVNPVCPVGPDPPVNPVSPVGPVLPVNPVNPVGPDPPVKPVSPVGPYFVLFLTCFQK